MRAPRHFVDERDTAAAQRVRHRSPPSRRRWRPVRPWRGRRARASVIVPNMIRSRDNLGLALGIAGVLLFGGTLPATRLAVTSFDPLLLTAIRASIAGCAGLILLAVLRRPLPARKLWPDVVIAGLCTIVGFPVLMALAMAHVPAAHGGVVLGIVPLATAAAAAIVTRERPSLGFWMASAAGA